MNKKRTALKQGPRTLFLSIKHASTLKPLQATANTPRLSLKAQPSSSNYDNEW